MYVSRALRSVMLCTAGIAGTMMADKSATALADSEGLQVACASLQSLQHELGLCMPPKCDHIKPAGIACSSKVESLETPRFYPVSHVRSSSF